VAPSAGGGKPQRQRASPARGACRSGRCRREQL